MRNSAFKRTEQKFSFLSLGFCVSLVEVTSVSVLNSAVKRGEGTVGGRMTCIVKKGHCLAGTNFKFRD